jgi:2-oxoglutarate dehydrogenase E2 component (dihydrolipoamide succinyltransferase)
MEIKIPSMGESVIEATIGSILKPSGSLVKADEEILELETEKVNQVLYAPTAGKLILNVAQGDTVKVGQVIGKVDPTGAGAIEEKPKAAPVEKPSAPKIEPPKKVAPALESEVRKKTEDYLAEISKPSMPAKAPSAEPIPPRNAARETRKKMSKLRKTIAERLVQVKNQTAMLTTFNEADMSAIIQVREREQEGFQKRHGVRLGFMSFFAKACVAALQEFPDLNASIQGDEIVYHNYYDIGIAVGTDKGVMVPVVRNVDQLSYAEFEKALKIYAEKARGGTISMDDLQGGTFTITNAGLYGSLNSTPILNPPQSAILGMHNILKRPVVVDDKIVIRPMMYLALSYDHRVVDGKDSVSFLMHIKKNLEEPTRLLLNL